MVKQIRNISVLLIIQGALEIIPGSFLTIAAIAAAEGGELKAPILQGDLSFTIFVVGPILLLGGILKVFGGARNMKFKDRPAGLIALGTCFLTMPACCCAPTALALGIWGLVVYMNDEVRMEFARVAAKGNV